MQSTQTLNKVTKRKYFFTFYNGNLIHISSDIIAANIIVEVIEKGKEKNIVIYDRNIKNEKTKIYDISQKEISRIKNEIGVYIRPKKIQTMRALKKAIVCYFIP